MPLNPEKVKHYSKRKIENSSNEKGLLLLSNTPFFQKYIR